MLKKSFLIAFSLIIFGYSICFSSNKTSPQNLTLDLKDFSISFSKIIIDQNYMFDVKSINNNTFVVSLELGDTIEGSEISIISDNIEVTDIYQKYETSITIMNEGPHLDLTDWKNYISEWSKLNKTSENKFKAYSYSEEDSIKFPQVTPSEIKKAVLKYGGQSWANLVSEIKSANDYPSAVAISKMSLKIEYIKNNKPFTKIVIFDVPMGC